MALPSYFWPLRTVRSPPWSIAADVSPYEPMPASCPVLPCTDVVPASFTVAMSPTAERTVVRRHVRQARGGLRDRRVVVADRQRADRAAAAVDAGIQLATVLDAAADVAEGVQADRGAVADARVDGAGRQVLRHRKVAVGERAEGGAVVGVRDDAAVVDALHVPRRPGEQARRARIRAVRVDVDVAVVDQDRMV